jgi:SAM-dependent methyltransferase
MEDLTMTSVLAPEMVTLKGRLKAMWESGDYGHFAPYLEPGAMEFFPRLDIQPGERVLDVACGAGQLALPAARAGAAVTAVDIASNLIAQAKTRAAAESLRVDFQEGDAEQLAFPDASFDVVFSLIGAMFAPRPELVASELLRVCRPSGRVLMANWTPAGFIGQMFKLNAKHVPPPAGMPAPTLWGDEDTVRSRFGNGVSELRFAKRLYPLRYPFAPSDVVEFFRAYYGPTNRAFASLSADGQAALRRDLQEHWSAHNTATDGGTAVMGEYLEVSAIRA